MPRRKKGIAVWPEAPPSEDGEGEVKVKKVVKVKSDAIFKV
jgi:hypothetical protein